MQLPGGEIMSKIKWNSATVVLLLAVVVFAIAAMGEGGKPRARITDLISTALRSASIDLSMDVIPKPMVDPSIDDGATFSYFARPSFQIGLRGEPYATQVTDNGHLWTGAAEWLVLLGEKPQPLNKRIYTLYKNYLPCIEYAVNKDGITYTVRAFQFWLDDSKDSPPVNFIRVTAENRGDTPARAVFSGGFMYGPKDHRCQQMKQMSHNPLWSYEMTDRAATRGGKVIYAWRIKPDALLARPGKVYKGAFRGAGRKDAVCLAMYRRDLAPGESFTAEFAMPHYPGSGDIEDLLTEARFDERLSRMESYWEGWLSDGARFEVSEKKVTHATRAYIIHVLMSQNIISDNEVEQHVNRLQYNRFWLRDSAFFTSMYEKWGYPEVAEMLARHFFGYQRDSGNFLSQPGQLDGWGQAVYTLGSHIRYTGDQDFAREAMPYVERAVGWLEHELENDEWGVMPPTDAFDNESITGRYTGHNFWALAGLAAAADLADAAGEPGIAEGYGRLRNEYQDNFMARLRQVAAKRGGLIPPGLDVPGGTDWGNLLAVYPEQIMDPFDPLVTSTFEYIRKERMQEGIAMWQKSMHHYVTERIAQTALVRGEQERALDDLYAMLLHTGACHEGFEWSIFAWNGRDYCINTPIFQTCNFTPHGWYAATLNILFRNMLVREQGESLHIASALSPEWTKPGDMIVVEDAPTWFGKVSYRLLVRESSALLEFSPQWRGESPEVVFHVPYYMKLKAASVNGTEAAFTESEIQVPARACKLKIEWERMPVEGKSHERIVEWYKDEYRRRWSGKHR
jgi:hypothetical protein